MFDLTQIFQNTPLGLWLILTAGVILLSIYLHRHFEIAEFIFKLPIPEIKVRRKENTTDIEREYSQGIRAMLLGNYEQSVLAFRRVIACNPNYRDTSERLKEVEGFLERENEKRRVRIRIGIAIGGTVITSCLVGSLLFRIELRSITIALGFPSYTPSTTPRPTFTPDPTQTRQSTPKPQFLWRQSADINQGFCPGNPGIYEVKGRILESGHYVGGIHVVLIDESGKVIAETDSLYPDKLVTELGINCREQQNVYNYRLDASTTPFNGLLKLRVTRSTIDRTPISPDVPISFPPGGGRWYIDLVSP